MQQRYLHNVVSICDETHVLQHSQHDTSHLPLAHLLYADGLAYAAGLGLAGLDLVLWNE